MKQDKMGKAYGTHRENFIQVIGLKPWKEIYFENLPVDGRIILKWFLKTGGSWLKLSGSGYKEVKNCSEEGNEPSDCSNCFSRKTLILKYVLALSIIL